MSKSLPKGTYYDKTKDRWKIDKRINGKSIRRSYKTEAELRAAYANLMESVERGGPLRTGDSKMLLADWLDEWLARWERQVKRGTWVRYESVVRVHIKPGLGHWQLAQLSVSVIQGWIDDMPVSKAHSAWPVLRIALRHAEAQEKIERAPTAVKLPSKDERDMHILEPHQLAEVLEHVDEEWAHDAIMGLTFTGARFGDFADIRPFDVDLEAGTIKVGNAKTGKRARTIGIAPPLRPIIERRRTYGDEYLWGSKTGCQLEVSNFHKYVWTPLREELPWLRPVRPHDLRHTCVSYLVKQGFHWRAVAEWVGHEDASMTLNVYSHLFDDDMSGMAAGLGDLWDSRKNVTPMRRTT